MPSPSHHCVPASRPHDTRRARGKPRFERPIPVDRIDSATRAALGPQLYAIFCESYAGLDEQTVCGEIIFRAGGQLSLLRAPDGAILGFGTACVHHIDVAGRRHGVFEGGIYCRRGVRGGKLWETRALRIVLAERLHHPLRPLHLVIEALTPASYRLAHRTFATIHPSPDRATPPAAAALLDAVITHRGLLRPTEHPFVACYPDPATHRDPERLMRSPTLRGDPAVEWYLHHNPGYLDGHLVCTLAPFGWGDIAASAARLVGRRIRNALRRSPNRALGSH